MHFTFKVLVTKPDFFNPVSRFNLRSTVLDLLGLNIVPIINTNDAVVSPAMPDVDLTGVNSSYSLIYNLYFKPDTF